MLFKDQTAAGQLLARELVAYANRSDVIVLALSTRRRSCRL